MVAKIIGLGTALPGAATPTDIFIAHAKTLNCRSPKQEKVLEELYRRTSITTRCSVLTCDEYGQDAQQMFAPPMHDQDCGPTTSRRMECYEKETVPLALASSQAALYDAQVEPQQVTHLITVSCTGFVAPGFDIELINRLPLQRSVERTHIGFMGCHGALNALRMARMIVEAETQAVVLLCSTELCSLHFQYGWSTDKLVANSLFADGSAALVLTADGVIQSPDGIMSGGDDEGWTVLGSGSFVVPDTANAMRWQIGDNGFYMHLSNQVPELVESVLPEWLAQWLAKFNLSTETIDNWVVHPGGPRILDAVQTCLTLPTSALDQSREILAECGNMSSPTVMFILEKLRATGRKGTTVMLGFGPGLTIEAALLEN